MENLLKKFVEWLWEIISWLQERLLNDAVRSALLEDLGIDSNTAPPSVDPNDLDSIQAYLESDDSDVLAFLELAGSLVNVMDAFESFLEPLIGPSGASSREFLYWLIQIASLDLLRNKSPSVYKAGQALGFVDEKLAAHELPTLNLLNFFGAWDPLITEEDARVTADFFFLRALFHYLMYEITKGDEELPFTTDVLVGWELPDEPATLADSISTRMLSMMFRAPIKVTSPPFGTIADDANIGVTATVAFLPSDHTNGSQGLFISLGGTLDFVFADPRWAFRVKADFPGAADFFITGDGVDFEGDLNARAEIEYIRRRAFVEETDPKKPQVDFLKPAIALPDMKGTRIEVGDFGFATTMAPNEFVVKMSLYRAAIVLGGDDPDSFLASVFPSDGLRADFDLDIGFDFVDTKFIFGSSSRLAVTIPIGKPLGPLTIFHITVAIGTIEDSPQSVVLTMSVSFSLKFFALTAVVDQIGYRAALTSSNTGGSMGPVDQPELGFMPPKGIGLTVDAGKIKGGGYIFFDPKNNEYAGMIDITFCKYTLKVTVLITTGLSTTPDYSLLIIGSFEGFSWPLPAGGEFTGIGVVIGMHRTMSVKAFQEAVKNRAVDAILFPEDPVANAPRLLQALKTLFPIRADNWIIGITLQGAWLNKRIVKIELGILFEFTEDALIRLVLVGQVTLGLPARTVPHVKVNFDVVGIIDFANEFLSVDSQLYDSSISGFPLTGDLAIRLRWGKKLEGAGALGGLHPRFPLPDGFPALKRLAITIGKGNNPRIRGEAYIGITTNTFQFGLRADLYVGASGFSLEGYVSLDLLIERNLDYFLGELDINVSVRYKGHTLAGLRLLGKVEGPGPWYIRGKVRIKVLFIKVTKRFCLKLGDETRPEIEPIDIWVPLKNAITSSISWTGQLPPARREIVTLRTDTPTGDLFLHPLGEIEMVQRVVPLGIEVDKFQNSPIAGDSSFEITTVTINGDDAETTVVKEHFAPGQFFDIEGDEAITRPSFEEFPAGLRIGSGGLTLGTAVETKLTYEEEIINAESSSPIVRNDYQIDGDMMVAGAAYGSMAKAVNSVQGKYRGPRHIIQRSKPGFVAVDVDSMTTQPLNAALPEDSNYTQVKQAIEQYLAAHPEDRQKLQIVRQHERQDA